MGKFIPNQNTWVGFIPTLTGTTTAPKVADITAAVDVTALVTGLNASTTGQTVPTPTFDSLFEKSIPGTAQGSVSIDGYRDDVSASDLLWSTLPRGTSGFLLVSRFGGKPVVGSKIEVWPIRVTSRSHQNMASNTAVMFTVTCATPDVAQEDVAVVA